MFATRNIPNADGEAIRSARVRLGYSTRRLARSAGVSHATISRVESGHRQPSASILSRLAKVLQVPVVDLIDARDALRRAAAEVEGGAQT
jgi:transcriptional regulator with XRE-family HTH domain